MKIKIQCILIFLTCLWILFLPALCKAQSPKWKFYFFGVDIKEIINSNHKDQLILGATTSFVCHVAGHYIAAHMVGAELRQDGFEEIICNPQDLNDNDFQWIARGGFVFQLGLGLLLTEIDMIPSDFTRGYNLMAAVEILSYPLRRKDNGDFHLLDAYGGDGDQEYQFLSTLATWNLTQSEYRR